MVRAFNTALNKKLGDLGRKPRVYLASPYSSGKMTESWEEIRFRLVSIAAMRLIRAGYIVFSPISHSHPVAMTQPALKNTHELWLEQDQAFLEWADAMVVLTLPGFAESTGVRWELVWCREHGKPVVYLDLETVYEFEKGEVENESKDQRLQH